LRHLRQAAGAKCVRQKTSSRRYHPPQQSSNESTVEPAEPVEVQEAELQEDTTPEDIEEVPQKQPLEELTVEELYRLARRYDIPGRSSMRKAELIEALETEGIVEAEV